MENAYWGMKVGEEKPTSEPNKAQSEILVKEPSILEVVRNRIYFYSYITAPNVMKLNKELRELGNMYFTEQKMLGTPEPTPIWLHIRSYGGSIFDGLAGMDGILKCPVPVYTVVDGCCASAGTFLSVVGNRRYMNKHSFILIHQLFSFFWGKYEEFKDEKENLDLLMNTIKDIYKEYTEFPLDELEEILKHDLWLSQRKCLDYKLVDEIL